METKLKRTGPAFLRGLTQALDRRQVAQGVALLDQAEEAIAELGPDHPHATELLLLVAQWVDVGYRDHHFLGPLLDRFPPAIRRRLPFEDYLRLQVVEGFRSLAMEDPDAAIRTLDFVLHAESELSDSSMITLAHFWKGRAHRKKGEYEAAREQIVRARQMTQKLSRNEMLTAVIQIHEAWLIFQKGLSKEALRLLAEAESVLKHTDHCLALGNIASARGRIVRRSGEYAKALEHFDRAIAIYSAGAPNHRNLARTLVNSAYVKRLLALQIRKRIDARANKSTPERIANQPSLSGPSGLRARHQQLCDEAIQQLQRARKIYELHHSVGIGAVVVNSGYLHLDRGDIDLAAHEALNAYQIGTEKNDQILMARARILETATENARVEEQLGDDVDTALHANHAKQFSEEALTLAMQTQNRRLLAAAYIARGMTAANEFFQEWDLAKKCAGEATELIGATENDHLVDDLAALKTRIMQAFGVNDTLRAWSDGVLGDKSFQQITEEFAEIVIPRVWVREGRKIARVAERLSISPKKVRRILRGAGFLNSLDSTGNQPPAFSVSSQHSRKKAS